MNPIELLNRWGRVPRKQKSRMATERPTGLRRIRITRLGIYFYHRRFTLSLTRGCRWKWLPGRTRWDSSDGVIWGSAWLEITWWEPGDDWGEKASEIRASILGQLAEELLSARVADYTKCPKCGGPTEWDRSLPPEPYWCDECAGEGSQNEQAKNV